MRRLAALAVAALALLTVLARPQEALAHAALLSADPPVNAYLQRAPNELALKFSEPLAQKSSSLRMLDASGQELTLGELSFSSDQATMRATLPQLSPGIYNVLWTNVSRVDGHSLRGSYPFTVLNPDGSVPDVTNTVDGVSTGSDAAPLPDGIAVRALALLGLAMIAGAAMLVLLWPGTSPWPRAVERLGYAGVATLAIATLLHLAVIEREYTGLGLQDLLSETRIGGFWLMRLGTTLLAAVAIAFFADAPKRAAAGVIAALGIHIYAFAATSHAAAGAGSSWATGIDLAHGVAAILWIGAVVGLAVTARLYGRKADYARLMPRFSLAASVLVFVLLGTGLLSGFVELDSPGDFTSTRYGWTLLAKLGLLVPLLGVAAYNARWGGKRLAAAAPGEPRRFVRLAVAEVALGLAVFLTAAMLTQTTASKSIVDVKSAKAFDQAVTANGVNVALSIDPNRTGMNTYRVTLTNPDGRPAVADRVRLSFRYRDDEQFGVSNLDLQPSPSGDNVYIGQGPFLVLEGNWRVEVNVRRADADDANAFFDVRPAGALLTQGRSGGSWSNPAPGLTWNEFGGLAIALFGLGFALWRTDLRRLGRWPGMAANVATLGGFGFGTLLLFGVHTHTNTGLPENPIYPDSDSIARGQALYEANCQSCHGRTGKPPVGLDLSPYPLDLNIHVPQHPDGQLYRFINDGVPQTAMRAWGEGDGSLSDEEIWHLVNYLRTFKVVDQ